MRGEWVASDVMHDVIEPRPGRVGCSDHGMPRGGNRGRSNKNAFASSLASGLPRTHRPTPELTRAAGAGAMLVCVTLMDVDLARHHSLHVALL